MWNGSHQSCLRGGRVRAAIAENRTPSGWNNRGVFSSYKLLRLEVWYWGKSTTDFFWGLWTSLIAACDLPVSLPVTPCTRSYPEIQQCCTKPHINDLIVSALRTHEYRHLLCTAVNSQYANHTYRDCRLFGALCVSCHRSGRTHKIDILGLSYFITVNGFQLGPFYANHDFSLFSGWVSSIP